MFGEKSTPDLGEHCHHRSFVKDLKIGQFHLSAQKTEKKQKKKTNQERFKGFEGRQVHRTDSPVSPGFKGFAKSLKRNQSCSSYFHSFKHNHQ